MIEQPEAVVHLLAVDIDSDESCKARGTVRYGEVAEGATLRFMTADGERFRVTVSGVDSGGRHTRFVLRGDAVRHLVPGTFLFANAET